MQDNEATFMPRLSQVPIGDSELHRLWTLYQFLRGILDSAKPCLSYIADLHLPDIQLCFAMLLRLLGDFHKFFNILPDLHLCTDDSLAEANTRHADLIELSSFHQCYHGASRHILYTWKVLLDEGWDVKVGDWTSSFHRQLQGRAHDITRIVK